MTHSFENLLKHFSFRGAHIFEFASFQHPGNDHSGPDITHPKPTAWLIDYMSEHFRHTDMVTRSNIAVILLHEGSDPLFRVFKGASCNLSHCLKISMRIGEYKDNYDESKKI